MSTVIVKKPLLRSPVFMGMMATALALAAAGTWWALQPTLPAQSDEVSAQSAAFWQQTAPGGTPDAAPLPTFHTGMESLPRSLLGTPAPEGLAEDAQGQLKISQAVRDVFDYFLSAVVDEPLTTLRARLVAHLHHRLGDKAAAQAVTLLDQYGAYQMAAQQVMEAYPGERPDQVRARLAALQNLRRATFGPQVAQAFFGEEEQYVQYTLDKADVMQDATLTAAQKAAHVTELRRRLPVHVQESLSTAEMLQSLEAVQAEWKQRGGTAEELRTAREAVVGRDGALRLEALDRENAAWEARMQAHLAQRAQIQGDAAVADSAKAQALEALRQRNFSAEEQARAKALEGLQDETVAAGVGGVVRR